MSNAHEIEQEAARMDAFRLNEVTDGLCKDRDRVVEALVFLARDMMADGADIEEHARHVSDLARVVTHLEDTAEEIQHLDEQRAFNRRALAQGIGKNA